MSSGLMRKSFRPTGFVFDHGIKNGEKFMHASDQSEFGRLPFGFESFVEVFNDGVKTSGAQCRHEQSASYRSSAPPDSATAFESAAVMWEGSDADQSGDLFAAEGTELWEFGHESTAANRPNTGGGAQDFLVVFPGRVFLDEPVEVLISAIKFLFEIGDMSGDTFFDRFRGGGQVVFLSNDHVDDLSAAYGQGSEFQGELVGQRAGLRANRVSVVSQDRGIDAIGLSQLSSSLGEVSDLAWISHDHRDLGANQSEHDLTFKTPGRFQDNQSWLKLLQVLDQDLDAGFIVSHRLGLCGWTDHDIELSFRYIDADKDKGNFQDTILLDDLDLLQRSSALRDMRAWITQATVRAFGEQGRDDPCFGTISNDRGGCGLSRPFHITVVHRDTSPCIYKGEVRRPDGIRFIRQDVSHERKESFFQSQ